VNITKLATGLRFPEGPIAMADASVVLVEIARGTITRVRSNGQVEVIAETGGGPNGAALGPDGHCYVCNNGGFTWAEHDGRLFPGVQPPDYSGGRIERVDLESGHVDVIYTECNGLALRGPNDIVFDRNGGFWFTDLGKTRPRERDRGAVYYAQPDGTFIEEAIFPLEAPNGIGLSPAEDELYVAETTTGKLWAYALAGHGVIDRQQAPRFLQGVPGNYRYDSLAVDAEGNVCVATLGRGGISIISPRGGEPRHVPMPDPLTTNICFGGPGLRTAYVTLSSIGELVCVDWPTAGLPLNFAHYRKHD
jgi:gluconolactonase